MSLEWRSITIYGRVWRKGQCRNVLEVSRGAGIIKDSLASLSETSHRVSPQCRNGRGPLLEMGEPVWRSGGKRKDLGSIPLQLSFLFKKVVVLSWTLSCDFVHHFLLKH